MLENRVPRQAIIPSYNCIFIKAENRIWYTITSIHHSSLATDTDTVFRKENKVQKWNSEIWKLELAFPWYATLDSDWNCILYNSTKDLVDLVDIDTRGYGSFCMDSLLSSVMNNDVSSNRILRTIYISKLYSLIQ